MRQAVAALAATIACCTLAPAGAAAGAGAAAAPPIHHVFVIMLENRRASTTFGSSSPAPYLSKTLRSNGAYLPNYHSIGHESNDNYIAMISGQAPNAQNQGDCQVFDDFPAPVTGSYGQMEGSGCVYPSNVQTIAGQLLSAGLTWRDYNQSMGADPTREAGVCAHPGVGMPDETQKATASDSYATRHNPFVYFHSIIDDTTLCDTRVVNQDLLPQDLASAASTPNYVFITPDLCSDGHDSPCANGAPGGLAQADGFLRAWVPRITGSPAFENDRGLLIVTFDESDTSDTSSCCGEIPGPGSPKPGINGPGGGDVGAVLLSPCIAPRTVSTQAYDHYTMLRSVEDLFGLGNLGYAALPGGRSFGSDVFTRACNPPGKPRLHAPTLASKVSRRPRVVVRWRPGDGAPSARFTLRVRRLGRGGAHWRTLLRDARRRSFRFSGRAGRTYQFQLQAVSAAGVASAPATATTVMPSGVRVRGFRGPWRTVSERGAWRAQAIVCSSASCSFADRFRGGFVWVVGDRGPRGGRLRVTVDGHSRVVFLRSRHHRVRQVLYRARLRHRRHRLVVQVLGGAVAIEGFGVRR